MNFRIDVLFVLITAFIFSVIGDCIENNEINSFFASVAGSTNIPLANSCCQFDVCGIPCPLEISSPSIGFGISVIIAIIIFCIIGILCYFCIEGKAENFFVAGRNLPLIVVSLTLASQSIDSNALLGNVDFSYKYHFWDGCCLPLGLGLSLIINALLLARHINNAQVMTLPDIYGRYYGRLVEIIVSIISCCSFLALLAGNLVGMSVILDYVLGFDQTVGIFLSGFIIILYTVTGGLFSVAYSDVVQSMISVIGVSIFTIYMLSTEKYLAPPPSIGMPNYIYPDNIGDNGICDLYNGIQCNFNNNTNKCCYNSDANSFSDNGAYPIGDSQIFNNQMTDAYALSPFPNAIIFNWATIFVLAFGNLGALDFQARCMAAKNGKHATIANIIAGLLTFIVGIPFAYMGSITRIYYGPDSQYAMFETDTCSKILDLPQCAMWLPDPNAFIKLLTHNVPSFLGGWCMISIVAASMSTSDGAILAISTVITRNVLGIKDNKNNIDKNENENENENKNHFFIIMNWFNNNLLRTARIMVIPFTIIACLIASFFKSNHSLGATGYLLIVAFDIMLAGCIVPLIAAFYINKNDISSSAALISIIGGCLIRIILEYSLPKDGFLIFPYDGDEYLDYGKVSTSLYPGFFDVNQSEKWNSDNCKQNQFP
eukprot:500634_1